MDKILAYAHARQEQIIALIQELVECESPSGHRAALDRCAELISGRLAGLAKTRTAPGGHLLCEFQLPGRSKRGQILALGHIDTVWPVGTLARMHFKRKQGRLWGPGVLDMKAGIAMFIYAMRALRELDLPVARRVLLQLNCDEEVGSASSRPLTERQARRSAAVLVLEPGTGLEGKLKTSRKGVGVYTLTVHGIAAHAGVDFAAGASAIVELARQIGTIAGFTDLKRGVTVNPGQIAGGTRSNVVAAEASAEIDVRVPSLGQAGLLHRRFTSLKPFDKRCRITIDGGLNRPPMERSPSGVALFRKARKLGRQLGLDLQESGSGGGSDGNFTAALGVPTLDGVGAVGEGAHAANESVLISHIAGRVGLLARLIQAI